MCRVAMFVVLWHCDTFCDLCFCFDAVSRLILGVRCCYALLCYDMGGADLLCDVVCCCVWMMFRVDVL